MTVAESPVVIEGVGTFTPPPDLTPEDCELLAREADEPERNNDVAIAYVTTLRTTRMTDIVTAIGTSGKLRIYSGTRPATGGTETTVLAELPLSATAGTVTSGVLTFSAITADASANATGTATWARLLTSANAAVADMSCGTSGSDLNWDSVSFVSGGNVAVTSLVLTEGNA